MCQKILTEGLHTRHLTAKFVPHLLTAEQKDNHVNLHWPSWASPKWSQIHVPSNHWWQMLGLWVWPGNKANVLSVKHGIISSTKESEASEVQCQDHVDCVLWHWRAGSSWVRP